MFNSPNPFAQQSGNSFASQSGFLQTSTATANPFAPKPFASTSPFGSQTGTSIFGGTSTGVYGAPQASSPFSSTTNFGASSSPAFGTTMSAFGASSTPAFGSSSSAFGGSSVFGQNPVFGGFGSTPTQTSPFMSTSQQSQPAFGSSIFGSSSPFGATTQSAFGATSTPGFGASSTPAFGASSTQGFGATSTQSFGATSSPAFGAPTTPFGSASSLPFGSTGSAFGVSSSPAFGSGGAFGASNTPVFGSPSTSAFGASSAPVFGASSTAAFGASSSPTFGFGSSPAFGQSTSAFGSNTFGSNSTPFGTQSSAFGAQSTTPTFGNTTFGQSTFGGQRGGTRIAAYTPTTEPDSGSGSQGAGKLESISGMPVYKDKCHEELRWEDYQLGDKGGPLPAGQSAVGVGFNSSTSSQPNLLTSSATFGQAPSTFGQAPANPFSSPASQPNLLTSSATFGQAPSTFGQAPANPFSTPTSSNPFAPKTSAFGTTPNFSFSSSAFAPSTSSNLFGSTVSPSMTSTAPFGSSPSLFNPSSTPAFGSQSTFGSATTAGSTSSFGPSMNFGNSQTPPLFPTSTPSIGQTGSAFGLSPSTFGQNTTSFGQSSLGTTPTSLFGNNLFSSTSSLMPSSSPAFGPSSSAFPTRFQPAQTQPVGAFGFGNFGQAQSAGTSGVGGTSSIFGQTGFGQLSASHASVAAQPVPATNPFGTLPMMPQMSIGRTGNASSIQYGISSMPVIDKPLPMKISSLLTSRHLSQRRIRLPAKKYHPKKDGSQVPFFSEDEETPGTAKADALFIPRENPRLLVIRPAEQWSTRTSAEKSASMKDTFGLHVNGKNHVETSILSDFSVRDENGNFAENGLQKESDQLRRGNEKQNGNPKTNGFHEDNIKSGDSYTTGNGNRAGEATIAYEHGAEIEALMPKLRHADYYTEPKIQELAAKERAYPGYCHHVKDFIIGRHGFGSIKFFGETDVRKIDLDSHVQFNNREVIVYMDETKKPPIGQGLNKPAEVTLLNIKCFDKKTGRQFTEGSKVEKYIDMLKRKAEDQGAEFVSYDPVKGEWKFKVNHFSKFGFGGDEDEASDECII